jgi:hypothetical protein
MVTGPPRRRHRRLAIAIADVARRAAGLAELQLPDRPLDALINGMQEVDEVKNYDPLSFAIGEKQEA